MPTPTDLQSEFRRLHEELQAELAKISVRLDRLEGIPNQDIAVSTTLDVSQPDLNDNGLEAKGEISFDESAWSFPLVVGLVAGPVDAAFAVLLLLLNLGIQVGFSAIIMSADFVGDPFDTQISFAQKWRTSVAHDEQYMDLAQTSLVSRVCRVDKALILSTTQSGLVERINSFLGLAADQFEPGFFQPGSLLCMLCILLWALCVYKEYRTTLLSLEAVWKIPRGMKTVVHGQEIHIIGKGRLKLLLFSYVARLSIATLLLFVGVQWLAQTASITDLMLNAVALNAILDVDEFLFAAFAPISMQLAVRQLQPVKMRYHRRRSQLESGLLFAVLVTTLLTAYLVFVLPLSRSMVAVKTELCGGNQTFVVAENTDSQLIVGLVTQEVRTDALTVVEEAVERHKFSPAQQEPDLIYFRSNEKLFNTLKDRDMAAHAASWGFCAEIELRPGGTYFQDPLIERLAGIQLRTASAQLGHFVADVSCAKMQPFCVEPEARLLRFICGATCGCSDPLVSPWHKVPSQGCNEECLQVGSDQLAALPCQDRSEEEGWQLFWDSYPKMISAFYGTNLSTSSAFYLVESLIQAMKSRGCRALADPALRNEFATGGSWCEGFPGLWRPLAWLCPESCGCLGSTLSWCPSSCRNATP